MKNRFDVQKQLGLARTGKITWEELKFKIPNILLPINPVFEKYLHPMDGNLFPSIQQFLEGNEPCVGYTIEEPLGIIPSQPKQSIQPINSENSGILPILVESKEIWGIPEKYMGSNGQLNGPLPILTANVPNTATFRYKKYIQEMTARMATSLA